MEVLGVEIIPKKNGTIYKLIRYPDAGYWVAYSRTAGQGADCEYYDAKNPRTKPLTSGSFKYQLELRWGC